MLLLAGGLLLTASCARQDSENGAQNAFLQVGNGAEPATLDPQLATALTDMNILSALFEGLTVLDEAKSQPLPGVARAWSCTEDGLTWTFELREEAKWSDGRPVSAEDFVFSFQRALSPKLAAEYAYLLWPLKNAQALNEGVLADPALLGAKAEGPHRLILTLENPCPWFLTLVASPTWYPVPRHRIEAAGA